MSMNHCFFMGRMTKDPELRRTNSGIAVTSFTLAVEDDFAKKDDGSKEVDFIDFVAWRELAEIIAKHCVKGRQVVVTGRLKIRKYTNKDGEKRSTPEVVVENLYFADSKKPEKNQGEQQAQAAQAAQDAQAAQAAQAAGYAPQGYPAPGYAPNAYPAAPGYAPAAYPGYGYPDNGNGQRY